MLLFQLLTTEGLQEYNCFPVIFFGEVVLQLMDLHNCRVIVCVLFYFVPIIPAFYAYVFRLHSKSCPHIKIYERFFQENPRLSNRYTLNELPVVMPSCQKITDVP